MTLYMLIPIQIPLLFLYGLGQFLSGASDFSQILCFMHQIPKGGVVQNSGEYTYWYKK